MDRRAFISTLAGGLLAAPLGAEAQQQGKVPRIGVLARTSAASLAPLLEAFRQGLRDLGWVEGKSISIEYRYAEAQLDRLPALAADLVRLKVEVIVTVDTPPTQAAKQATSTIPIVIAVSADPVGAGLVSSLAHPGGNTTGLSLLAPEADRKNLELLRETIPRTKRVAMIWDPDNRGMALRLTALQTAALGLAIEFQSIAARSASELVGALTAVAKDPPDGLIVLSPIYAAYSKEVVEFATRTRVPLLFDASGLAGEPGALLSYGVDLAVLFRRAAAYVDRILKGAKPGELPVEQPTEFELVINLKTAKKLGLTIPPSLLLRADQVIE